MKSYVRGVVALSIATALFAESSRSAVQDRPDPNAIRVAIIYPEGGLLGDFMCISKALVEEAKGSGLKINASYFNNQNDTTETVRLAKQIASEKFDVVVGTRTSQQALVAAEIFEEKQIPFLVPLASHPAIADNRKFVVRMVSSSKHYAELYAKFIVDELRPKTLAVLENLSAPYSQYYASEVSKKVALKNPKIKIKRFEIVDGFNAYQKLAEDIIKVKPDLLYLPIYTTEAVNLFDALRDQSAQMTVIANASINDGRALFSALFDAKERKPSRLTIIHDGIWDGKFPGVHGKKYESLMARSCPAHAQGLRSVVAFDVLSLLFSTLKSHPKTLGEKLVQTMKAEQYVGLLGDYSRDALGESRLPLNLFRTVQDETKFMRRYP